jgi:3-hydroxybutyryl-CoA dehydrogenase
MIENITIIGAGTMGSGIAHVFAQKGFKVILSDVGEAQLQSGLATITKNIDRQVAKYLLTEEEKTNTIQNISVETNLNNAVAHADLVIEAATENEKIKLDIFRQLDAACRPDCILATNTSSISITKIAAVTMRPGKVIGMHFMNPVPIMKLVEIINGFLTDASVTKLINDLAIKLGKMPCVVNDYPGFVANRILMPMINEAIYTLYEGVAGVQEIDTVMKLGMAHPMGPLQLADFIGLDVCQAILQVLHQGFGNPKYFACPLLNNMVAAGKTGVKSGEGFYTYTPGIKELVVSKMFNK